MADKWTKGSILGDKARANFVAAARAYMSELRQDFYDQDVIGRYTRIANDFNLNPDNVVFDPFEGIEGLSKPEPFEWGLLDNPNVNFGNKNTGAGTQPGTPTDLNFGRAKQQDG